MSVFAATSEPSSRHQDIRAKCFHPTGSFIEFKKEDVEQSVPSRFEQQVLRYPERIAIKTESTSLTYRQLDSQANRLAQALLHDCGEGEEPVILLFEHGAAMIIAIIAILKAGKMYVSLNPSHPHARLEKIIADSGAKIMVTNELNEVFAANLIDDKMLLLNVGKLSDDLSDQCPNLPLTPETCAYIMYTSGSSGVPKGLLQNHRNLLHNTMVYTNQIHICPEDRLTLLHSSSYGASINDLFGALLNGATLLIFDVQQRGTLALVSFVLNEQASIFHSIPAVFRSFAQAFPENADSKALRIVHLSGAPASKWDFELYKKRFASNCVFVHRFGSTEAMTVFLNLMDKECKIPGNLVPVGFPVEDKDILLIDENKQPVGANSIGEIVIQSDYLSAGYWHDPDRTSASFSPGLNGAHQRLLFTGDLGRMLVDGGFEYIGRRDSRVKIRGHRIEMAEVEIAILNSGRIKEVAVTVNDNHFGEERLVAYLVPSSESDVSVSELRQFLEANLPSHMIPSAFVFLPSLPILPNGKLNRGALPPPVRDRPQLNSFFMAPRTPIEKVVADIWLKVLGLDRVGIRDNFLDLGGNSLLAMKILSDVHDRFQVQQELRTLFENPTVEQFSLTVTERLARNTNHLKQMTGFKLG